MTEPYKIYIYWGIFLLIFGSIFGIVLHEFGFPWSAVIAIASGVYCLFEGIKLWLQSKLRRRYA